MILKVTFSIRGLLIFMVIAAVILWVVRNSVLVIDREFNRVHLEEQHVADYVRAIGGTCTPRTRRGRERYIVAVSLSNTSATNAEVEIVMRLPHITELDLSHTAITNKSITTIVSHNTQNKLFAISINGSGIDRDELERALRAAGQGARVE